MPNERPDCRCVICHDYGDRDEADHMERWSVEQVQQYGWSVVMVPADDEGLGFAYTIGLWHTHHTPELAMFGLDIRIMHELLNLVGRRAAAGAVLEGGQEHHDVIKEFPVVLKSADLRWYRAFFGRAISFYRRPPFPVLQMAWPDAEGRFLWQPAIDARYRESQPQLWLEPARHPEGVWAALATG